MVAQRRVRKAITNLHVKMILHRIHISNFRNLVPQSVDLHSISGRPASIVCIAGDNGSGKSSFLEAIYYASCLKSFRTVQNDQLIGHGKDYFNISIFGESSVNSDIFTIGTGKTRESSPVIKIDGEHVSRAADLAKRMPIVFLGPESFNLISGAPAIRRSFLDFGLFHVKQSYQDDWLNWRRCLFQRNALLRRFKSEQKPDLKELDSWDHQFSNFSEGITRDRTEFVEKLQSSTKLNRDVTDNLGSAITGSFNEFDISFWFNPGYSTKGGLQQQLLESRARDIKYGYTTIGPQKADLVIKSGDYAARDILSRGQQKRAIIDLSLSQLEIVKSLRDELCVVLLDDLGSELDISRQKLLLRSLINGGYQVIFTMLSAEQAEIVLSDYIQNSESVTMFHVEHGQLQSIHPFKNRR